MAPFLLAVTVLGRASQNMGQTTFPLIARQLLGIGNSELGTLTAVAGLAAVLTAATLAARATASSALRVLSAGQCLVLLSFVLFAIPSGQAGLWVAAVVLGVGGGLVFPAAMTAIGSAPAGQRARALAVFAVSLSFGLVVGPLVEAGVLHLLSGSLRDAFAAMLPLPAAATAISIVATRHQRGTSYGDLDQRRRRLAHLGRRRSQPAGSDLSATTGSDIAATGSDLIAPDSDLSATTGSDPLSMGSEQWRDQSSGSDRPAAGSAPWRDPSVGSSTRPSTGSEDPPAAPVAGGLPGEPAVLASSTSRGHVRATASRFTNPGPGARPRLLSFPAYRLALATMLTYQAPFAALVTFGALLARHVDGASAAGASLAFGVFFTVSLAVRGVVAAKAPIRHQRAVLSAAVLATATGIAILGGASGFLVLLAAMAVLGAPHGLTFPMASAVLAEGVPPGILGRANARLMASANLVTIVVPFACGWLASAVGYRDMYLVMEIPVVAFGSLLASALRSFRQMPPSSTGAGMGKRSSEPTSTARAATMEP